MYPCSRLKSQKLNKAQRHAFSTLLLAAGVLFTSADALRADDSAPICRWPTKDGQFFEARFVRLQGTSVMFAREGWKFSVPISNLTPESLEMARRQAVKTQVALAIPATFAPPPPPISPPALPVAPSAPPVPPVASISYGPSILAFCRENVGRKVGSGQCASLASAALKSVGAATRGGADWPGEGDYVWGEPVAWIKSGYSDRKCGRELSHVEAGDIVQFHNTRFNGFNHSEEGTYRMEAQHHTAVVESVDPERKTMRVLHQNWNGHQTVRRQTLYLDGMTRGWLRFYHAVPG